MADTKTSAETDAAPPLRSDSVRLARGSGNRRTTLGEVLALVGDQQIVSTYSSASALGAAIANAGSGGTDGATVLTVVGGTGTPPQFNATIAGGVLVSIDSVAVAGGPDQTC